jgi:MOSC domain-containing protein YiiM
VAAEPGRVVAVALSPGHTFSKARAAEIHLRAGLGVDGDAHAGATVKHRSRVAADPTRPNLRQVHLIHAELFDELRAKGFAVAAGDMGENVTTCGIDLLRLPRGTLLRLGQAAVVEVMGLRNPCRQLDDFQAGLTRAVLGRDANGGLLRKAGIMSVVRTDGWVRPGDRIRVDLPPAPHDNLEPV